MQEIRVSRGMCAVLLSIVLALPNIGSAGEPALANKEIVK